MKIFRLTFFCFYILGCINDKSSIKEVTGEINNVTINHVIVKRDWCRFSKVIFMLTLKNNSNRVIFLNNPREINYCKIESTKPQLFIKSDIDSILIRDFRNKRDRLILSLSDFDKELSIKPFSTLKVECVLLTMLYGRSLEMIFNDYKKLFDSKFTIETSKIIKGNNMLLSFKKNKNFKIILKLDDLIVPITDTILVRAKTIPI